MQINLVYDSSVDSAPAGFETAVAAAAQDIDSLITNDITVSIDVGYGEDNGQPLTGNESTGGPTGGITLSYAELKAELAANVSSAADGIAVANLPEADPTDGGGFELFPAQEKALGLLPANSSEIDGTVGFSSTFDFIDDSFVGVVEHELTHALGRISNEQFYSDYDSVLDLFRYAAPGTLATAATAAPYFSIDGGTTNLNSFDTTSDWADWAASTGPDSFDAYVDLYDELPITPADVAEMNVLGFSVATTPGTTTSFAVNSETAFNSALAEVRFSAMNTNYTISLAAGLPEAILALNTALFAVNVPAGGTLTINGDGQTIDGGGQQGGIEVSSGNVVLQNLTIAHTDSIGGVGASGAGGGGGGAGEGGGLLIDAGATVTLDNVAFNDDAATGGAGGAAQNAYLGGNGGALDGTGAAILNGASMPTQSGGGPGGSGEGGGGGANSGLSPDTGAGGAGGWGGGGGGGGSDQTGTSALGGVGGFGGGAGGDTYTQDGYGGGGGGGGGLGAGGDVFISNGGALVIAAGILSLGTVAGGAGGAGFDAYGNGPTGFGTGTAGATGLALGSGIFIQGSDTLVLAPQAGQIVTIDDVIADQTGSGGTGINAGAGAVSVAGEGTVALGAQNDFTGGIYLQSGTLELNAAGAAGTGPIDLAGPADLRLDVAANAVPTNQILDFMPGDMIDLTGFVATGHTYSGTDLVITSLSGNATLDVPGLSLADFTVTPNSTDDLTTITTVSCFATGTRISTARGEVAVEAIRVGDKVRVLLGDGPDRDGFAPVIWVGRREVDCTRHPHSARVWPVRIAAGAFGPDQPRRDLLLSPDHSVYVEEVLIPIRHLINGRTIVQVKTNRVTYHHLELTQHNVLLADGMPAESFLDMKDGSSYANRPGPVRLYQDHSAHMWEAFGCARLVVTGPELAAARALANGVARTSGECPAPARHAA